MKNNLIKHTKTEFSFLSFLIKMIVVILLAAIPFRSFSQASVYVLKAVYLEKFSRFITWPEESLMDDPNQPFIISVIGKCPLTENLKQIYGIQEIKKKRVIINQIEDLKDIEGCHILFIAESEKKNLDKIIALTKHQPILTVAETKGFAEKGVLINFYESDNKLRFEINETAVLKSPLQMSFYLLNSAKIVKPVEE